MSEHRRYGVKLVGWGPFRIPGERKRLERAHRESVEFMALLQQVTTESSNVNQHEENQP